MFNRRIKIDINKTCKEYSDLAKEKGFDDNTPGEYIALMHSELSEALEEYRKGEDHWNLYFPENSTKPEGLVVELADAVIRIFHFCGKYNLDLAGALETKIAYNKTRSHKHGGKKI